MKKKTNKKITSKKILNSIALGASLGLNLMFLIILLLSYFGYGYFYINLADDVDMGLRGKFYDEVEIFTDDLTQKEADLIIKMINDTKPEYEMTSREIHFVKEWSNCSECLNDIYNGVNYRGMGKVYVKYTGDFCQMRRTYCHELLHNIIETEDEEWFVDDIDDYYVCYEDKIC